jgi:hypothetical protein
MFDKELKNRIDSLHKRLNNESKNIRHYYMRKLNNGCWIKIHSN